MKTYKILNKNDILQEGDECFCEGTYLRPVIEKQYRILEQAETSLPTDEWWFPDCGWVTLLGEVGHSDNTSVRRRLISDTAPTSVGRDSNRNELLSQSSDLKRRLENALSDKILLHANLSDRNDAINLLKKRIDRLKERLEDHVSVIEDKDATIRRLSEKLENIDSPTVEHVNNLKADVSLLATQLDRAHSDLSTRKAAHVKQMVEREEEFEVVVKTLLADNQLYRRVIDKLTQDGPEEV